MDISGGSQNLFILKEKMKNLLRESVKEVLTEATKIHFGKYDFLLKIDTNEDPKKKGIKIQFIPTQFGQMNQTTQNDIAIELETRLEKGLAEYGLRVERDRGLKDRSIIGFFIFAEYLDRLIRLALQKQNPSQDGDGEEGSKEASLNT